MLMLALECFLYFIVYLVLAIISYLNWVKVLSLDNKDKDFVEAFSFALSMFWFMTIPIAIILTILYFLVNWLYKGIVYITNKAQI